MLCCEHDIICCLMVQVQGRHGACFVVSQYGYIGNDSFDSMLHIVLSSLLGVDQLPFIRNEVSLCPFHWYFGPFSQILQWKPHQFRYKATRLYHHPTMISTSNSLTTVRTWSRPPSSWAWRITTFNKFTSLANIGSRRHPLVISIRRCRICRSCCHSFMTKTLT